MPTVLSVPGFRSRRVPHSRLNSAARSRVAVSFFGDGATNQGVFHETLNLAAVWELPVVFVCENNRFGMGTPQHEHQRVEDIAVRAPSYDIPGVTVDGNDCPKGLRCCRRSGYSGNAKVADRHSSTAILTGSEDTTSVIREPPIAIVKRFKSRNAYAILSADSLQFSPKKRV